TGDTITLDVAARRISLDVDEAEIARRLAGFIPKPPPARGYARLFETTVLQADEGCDFDFLCRQPGAEK
ncbi:MAG: hypothetical protein B7Z80_17925, partial [Rhodospirillales bacterium 20-64-7]